VREEERGGRERWQTENILCMIHRLHPHIRGSPDVAATTKRNGIGKERNDRDIVIVSQTLLQEGGRRHAAHCYTVSQSFFFPIAMPNSILKVILRDTFAGH